MGKPKIKVKVVRCNSPDYWYYNKIGEFFIVCDYECVHYRVLGRCSEQDLIEKSDCEVIPNEIEFAEYLVENYSKSMNSGKRWFRADGKFHKSKSLKSIHKKWLKKYR